MLKPGCEGALDFFLSGTRRLVGYGETDFTLLGVLDVNVAIELDGRFFSGVDYVADGLLLAYDAVVVAAVARHEDRLTFGIMPGDMAFDTTETGDGPFGGHAAGASRRNRWTSHWSSLVLGRWKSRYPEGYMERRAK